jgi:tryptophanyl-tRNA synthetase
MAADILLYKANAVPVGLDQAPHLEFTREIVRTFNHRFKTQVLIEPEMKVTRVPKVLGTDGQQKMSKSLNNQIELAATPEETEKRVLTMVTDPARIHRSDPGNPDICNVFALHNMLSTKETVDMVNLECRRAGIGCVEDKHLLAAAINKYLEPFRTRRHELEKDPNFIWDVLRDGEKRARVIAEKTMAKVREVVGLP